MIRRLLDWLNSFWEVLFYIPERPAAKLSSTGKTENADSVGMVI